MLHVKDELLRLWSWWRSRLGLLNHNLVGLWLGCWRSWLLHIENELLWLRHRWWSWSGHLNHKLLRLRSRRCWWSWHVNNEVLWLWDWCWLGSRRHWHVDHKLLRLGGRWWSRRLVVNSNLEWRPLHGLWRSPVEHHRVGQSISSSQTLSGRLHDLTTAGLNGVSD